MKKITDVSELPDWFRNRVYRKKLSDVDWFRAIRFRQKLLAMIEMHDEDYKWMSKKNIESRRLMLEWLEKDNVRPDSMIYHVSQEGLPIHELTVAETTYLALATQKAEISEIVKKYEKLLVLWSKSLEEMNTQTDSLRMVPYPYEKEIGDFFDQLDEDEDAKLESSIYQHSQDLGNPLLSYGRPLNGIPVTIDTQFDDATIMQHVKEWLAETRKKENEKARRPFNQNDFDDWSYYKIREIFDLQTWAILNDVKILDRVMADALWPLAQDNFSPIDVFRTTARKKTNEIFQFETVVRLYGQLRLKHGENFLTK